MADYPRIIGLLLLLAASGYAITTGTKFLFTTPTGDADPAAARRQKFAFTLPVVASAASWFLLKSVSASIFATVVAVVACIIVQYKRRWLNVFPATALLVIPAAIPGAMGDYARGPGHDLTAMAAIVTGVSLVAVLASTGTHEGPSAVRFHTMSLWSTGVTAYGFAVIAIVRAYQGLTFLIPLIGLILAVATMLTRKTAIGTYTTWLMVLAFAIGAGVFTPKGAWTHQQQLVGFNFGHSFQWIDLVTTWRPDALYTPLSIVMIGLYLHGVRRLRSRGVDWSRGRTLAWVVGWLGILASTTSAINKFSYGQISVHMAVHMILNLFVPALLALAGPVTLLFRVLHPAGHNKPAGFREWVHWLVHSRYIQLLSNPLIAIAIYVATLYGLYFTPIFGYLVPSTWGHAFMNLHFLVSGYLFYWPIVGIDPGVRRLQHLGRVALLFIIMPFHAFFGIASMSMAGLMGANFYRSLGLLDAGGLTSDQSTAGAIAWGSGEIPLMLVVIALMTQWMKSDRRSAQAHDRQSDRGHDEDLDAYNKMLQDMAAQRGR